MLLLAANAGFFAWQYHQRGGLADRDAAQEGFQPTDAGVAGLVLLHERAAAPADGAEVMAEAETAALSGPVEEPRVPAEPDAAAGEAASLQAFESAPEPGPAPAPAIARHCFEFGPANDRVMIERADAAATRAGARTTVREITQSRVTGYLIRLPENFTLAEANARLRDLKQRGLDDIAIVSLPDKSYKISLGVYSRESTMEERRAMLVAKGLKPEVEQRVRGVTLYTLAFEYESADPAPLQSLRDTLAREAPEIGLREADCR